ncbi:hypothetical protein SLA2020_132630 [Shorea laevis]
MRGLRIGHNERRLALFQFDTGIQELQNFGLAMQLHRDRQNIFIVYTVNELCCSFNPQLRLGIIRVGTLPSSLSSDLE